MHICFITNKYPNEVDKNTLVFLKQLVDEISNQGIKCSVICPVPTNLNRGYKKLPIKDTTSDVTIYYPRYFGLGQKDYLFYNPAKFTTNHFTKAVDSVIKTIDPNTIDAFYGHFVTPAGIASARMGRKYNKPSFMAHGEATYMTINHFGGEKVKKELSTLSGVIAVSSQNKEMISKYVDDNIVEVFPNAINNKLFQPLNKNESRKKFGFDKNDFIVSFVGSFDRRKGIDRLEKAIDSLDDKIKLAAAGKGKINPTSKKCIWDKPIEHDNLPAFYSSSDVFVLPTRNEGCCNAIIEALACGIPIISSNLPFNADILDENNSILIDPNSIKDIASSIKKLQHDTKLREEMAKKALKSSKNLTLNKRAHNIILFIKSCSKKYKGEE